MTLGNNGTTIVFARALWQSVLEGFLSYFTTFHSVMVSSYSSHRYTFIHLMSSAGTENYLCPVNMALLNDAKAKYTKNPTFVPQQFSSFAELYMMANGLSEPRDWNEALQLYYCLLQELESA